MKFQTKWPGAYWRSAALALAVAGVVGCDPVAKSNKDVVSKMNDGIAKLAKADGFKPLDAVTAAKGSLTSAAGEKLANPGYQAIAAASVGALDQGTSQSATAPFFQDIVAARQTLVELRQLAVQVDYNNTLAAGNKKSDPRDAQTKLADQIRMMQGGADAGTWGGQGATLPNLAAVKQETARLQGVISQDQQKLTDLNKQRSDAISTSETQLKHADSLKGDEAVRAFADGSESRRKADDLAIQIDSVQDHLTRAQSDLTIQQGQEAAINAGISLLQGHIQQLNTGWTDAQSRAAHQLKIATIATKGDDADKTNKQNMTDLAQTLTKQLDDVRQARSAAIDQLAEADKYYTVARDQSQALIKTVADKITSPGKGAKNYASLKQTMHPQQYALQIGVVRRDAAGLIAAEASLLAEAAATRAIVTASLGGANLDVPAELASIDQSQAKTLADDADTRLGESADMLANVESGDTPPNVKNAAKVAHLVTLGARIQLASLKTTLGDSGAKAAADQYMSDAKALKDDIIAAGMTLPALPGELGTAPPPAAAPIPAPTDAPPTPSTPAPTPGTPAPAAAG